MGYNIAIDGPAGAGKSTIAKRVAKEKGYIYVDTGAMYRALAIYFLKKNILPEEIEKITDACKDADVSIGYVDGVQQVYLNGENVTSQLREEAVGNMASVSSALPDVKVYLTASVLTRAKRRYAELKEKGIACDLEQIAHDIEERDWRDMNRETAPLCQAADAVYVDSSDMTIEEVVETIIHLCK